MPARLVAISVSAPSAATGRDGVALRAACAEGLVEVEAEGADEAVEPADRDLAAAQRGGALDVEAALAQPGLQGARGEVDEVARDVEVQPLVAKDLGLDGVRVGHSDDNNPAGDEKARCLANRLARIRQVLERVPEDDGGPLPLDFGDRAIDDVGVAGVGLEAHDLAAAGTQRVDQHTFAGADIEDRAVGRDLVYAPGLRGAGPAEQCVTKRGEAAPGVGPVPGAIGGAKRVIVGPGVGRCRAAARADDAALAPLGVAAERHLAPGAGGRRRGDS